MVEQDQSDQSVKLDPCSVLLLKKVGDLARNAMALRPKLLMFEDQLRRARGRVAIAMWRGRVCLHPAAKGAGFKALQLKVRRLAYDAGVHSEELFRLLCSADSIISDSDDIRRLRKAQVLSIKHAISQADSIRIQAQRLERFVVKRTNVSAGEAEEGDEGDNTSQDRAMASCEEAITCAEEGGDEEEEEEEEDEEEDEKEEDEEEDEEDDEEEEDQEEEDQTTRLRSQLPRFRPQSRRRRVHGGVQVILDVSGVLEDSLRVLSDATGTLTISGIKPKPAKQARLHHLLASPRSHAFGWFEERYQVSRELDLDSMDHHIDHHSGNLIITIPQHKPQAARHHSQAHCHSHQPRRHQHYPYVPCGTAHHRLDHAMYNPTHSRMHSFDSPLFASPLGVFF
jgi:hypothetical protein